MENTNKDTESKAEWEIHLEHNNLDGQNGTNSLLLFPFSGRKEKPKPDRKGATLYSVHPLYIR